MDIKFFIGGVVVGALIGFFRMKSAPTPMTHQAPGFGR
jgi:F0F1-type ATP synthase assembly protein I